MPPGSRETVQAGSAWRQALSILEDMDDPGAGAVRRKLQDAGLPPAPRLTDLGRAPACSRMSVSALIEA
jgi:hypothetical protein